MIRSGLILTIGVFLGLFLSVEVIACCGGPKLDGITLKIEGNIVERDIKRLESALGGIYAVKDIRFHPETKELAISLFSEMVTEEELIARLKQAGFNASLPETLRLRLKESSPKGLEAVKSSLNNMLGLIVKECNVQSGQITLDIYKPWVRDHRKILKLFEDARLVIELPSKTFAFQTSGMTEVDAFDVRAYLRQLFGVVTAEIELDTDSVLVTIYKDWVGLDDVVNTIQGRGFTKVVGMEEVKTSVRRHTIS